MAKALPNVAAHYWLLQSASFPGKRYLPIRPPKQNFGLLSGWKRHAAFGCAFVVLLWLMLWLEQSAHGHNVMGTVSKQAEATTLHAAVRTASFPSDWKQDGTSVAGASASAAGAHASAAATSSAASSGASALESSAGASVPASAPVPAPDSGSMSWLQMATEVISGASAARSPAATVPSFVHASRSPWQALAVTAALRSSTQASGGSSASASSSMSGPEARAVLDLFFGHMTSEGKGAGKILLPPELQQAAAQPLLQLLQRLWAGHVPPAAAGAVVAANESVAPISPDHCGLAAGRALLGQAAKAAVDLGADACGAKSSLLVSAGPALPYVLLRRLAMAVLQLVYDAGVPQHEAACRAAVQEVAPSFLRAFTGALNCSRGYRHAVELLHISKSGGTSMCQLAAASQLYNPGANMNANCLVPRLYDEPKWTRLQPGQDKGRLWPAVSCPSWLSEPSVACKARADKLKAESITFLANEVGLHEGAAVLGSAKACPELETVVVLREPVQRARSHVSEVMRVYQRWERVLEMGEVGQL